MIYAAWFLLGAVFGTVFIIVVACCSVASDCDREEEQDHDGK